MTRIRLMDGVWASRKYARSSPEWQAAYHLAKGATGWSAWRARQGSRQRRTQYVQLDRFEFEGLRLSGADLTSLGLRKARFKRCDLREANLGGVNLNDAVFEDCQLTDIGLHGARLARADLRNQDLSGADLCESVRADWLVEGVLCTHAWIASARSSGDPPQKFAPGEFAMTYGGFRIALEFPDGGQPIDLLALPFHFERLRQEHQDMSMVLSGLRTSPRPALEVRLEHTSSNIEMRLGATFAAQVPETREQTAVMLERAVEATQQQARVLEYQARVIERLLVDGGPNSLQITQAPGSSLALGVGPGSHAQVKIQASYGLTAPELQGLVDSMAFMAESLASRGEHETSALLTAGAEALRSGDEATGQSFMRKHGARVLEVAQEIGTATAAQFLSKLLGLT